MSTNIKNVILKKKIGDVVYDLMVKTSADLVTTSEGKTVSQVITELIASIALKATTQDIDDRINAIVNGAPETFDTLKEIADYITEHEEVYTALNAAIGNKVDKVEGMGLSSNDFTNELKEKLISLKNITTLSADNVTETTDKKFVSAAEKTKISTSARILVNKTQPSDLTENDIWLQDVTE